MQKNNYYIQYLEAGAGANATGGTLRPNTHENLFADMIDDSSNTVG